jgi:DMSO/TMAO reductase YedYZ molybdopterin-dependent catalytic subunit
MSVRPGKRDGGASTGGAKPRVPPGQRVVRNWPLFTHGRKVPRVDLSEWAFSVGGLVEEERSFTWEEFTSLPQVTIVSDIHCVTRWSRLDNRWEGVLAGEVVRLARPKPEARFVMLHCYGGYSTNLRLDDLLDDDVLFALKHDGEPLSPEHGGPVRLVLPKLYFWKSAKWVRGMVFMDRERPGFWEMHGYHIRGDPWREERYS